MMYYFFVFSLLIFSSCHLVKKVEQSTQAIENNYVAVNYSSEGIRENAEEIKRATESININRMTVEQSSEAIKDNAAIVTKSTQDIAANRHVVEQSSLAIDTNRFVVENSSQAIAENQRAVEESTAAIVKNAKAIEEATSLVARLKFDPLIFGLLLFAVLFLLLAPSLLLFIFLIRVERRVKKLIREDNTK